ncbi:Peptidase propeptide and YPEB domain-containing protein [Lactobacillus crispatus]|uniref:PepSY domain-containing protein n=1 Tax=Lactobacillus crispatus TaxID=47770 RepID=UPI0018E3E514|nr:PepSY domain-containing protein [Lactobacillus crispatus]MBI1714417.1 Peptidase propeptide and YPEB domain-containing protein [Lactobacillus crispatus]
MKKFNIKKVSLAAAALGLAAGGASLLAINQANASTGTQTQQSQSNNTEQNQSNTGTASINLSQEDAVNKFYEKYGSKSIKEIELEQKKNSYVYEIEGFDSQNEYKVKIDASNGNILKAESEKLDSDDEAQALDLNNMMTREQATQLAQTQVSGQPVEWSLEMDDDQPIWKVEFEDGGKKTEVEIDAKNQKIIKTETEDDEKDHNKDYEKEKNDSQEHQNTDED